MLFSRLMKIIAADDAIFHAADAMLAAAIFSPLPVVAMMPLMIF